MDDSLHSSPDPRERLRSGVEGLESGSRTVRARSAVEELAAAGVTNPTSTQIIEAANRL